MHDHIFFFLKNPDLLRTIFNKFVNIPNELFKLAHVKKMRIIAIDIATSIMDVADQLTKSQHPSIADLPTLQRMIYIDFGLMDIIIQICLGDAKTIDQDELRLVSRALTYIPYTVLE